MLNPERVSQSSRFAEFSTHAKQAATKASILLGAAAASVGVSGALSSPASADGGFNSEVQIPQLYCNYDRPIGENATITPPGEAYSGWKVAVLLPGIISYEPGGFQYTGDRPRVGKLLGVKNIIPVFLKDGIVEFVCTPPTENISN